MYHYVYKLTEEETNKFYFGSRSSSVKPEDDTYMGSPKTWTPTHRITKQIIKKGFKSREETIKFESMMIKENINNKLNENYHIPNEGFHTVGKFPGFDKDDKFIGLITKDDARYMRGELKGRSGGRTYTDEIRKKFGNAWRGKTQSEESNKKRSDALKGIKRGPFSVEHKAKLSKAKLGKKRKKFTEETLKRMSDGRKGIRHTKETLEKIAASRRGKKYIHHPVNKLRKQVNPEAIPTYISNGWKIGMGPKDLQA